jgi:S1-C subfamily serine protease
MLALATVGCSAGSGGSAGSTGAAPASGTASSTPTPAPAASSVPPVDGGTEDGNGVFSRLPDLVQQVEPSIVTIATRVGVGSGVVYRSNGVIVTNAHVVEDFKRVTVTIASGAEMPGRVLATDTVTDLAVVRVDRHLPATPFETQLPRAGELVLAMGSPLGFENSATAGIVSGLNREIPGAAQRSRALDDLIQTDAAISPGNSGGALVNADGRVVGINEAYIPPQAGAVSIGFAIPAATVVDTVDELLASGTATHPFVGIVPAQITPQIAQALDLGVDSGVLVAQVVENGPAAKAGIRRGDVIVEFNHEDVEDVGEFLGALRDVEPGEAVDLVVVRDGARKTVRLRLGELQE